MASAEVVVMIRLGGDERHALSDWMRTVEALLGRVSRKVDCSLVDRALLDDLQRDLWRIHTAFLQTAPGVPAKEETDA